jgi:hypothetical protein
MVLSTTSEQVTEFILVYVIGAGRDGGGAHQTMSILGHYLCGILLPLLFHGRFVRYNLLFCNTRQEVCMC